MWVQSTLGEKLEFKFFPFPYSGRLKLPFLFNRQCFEFRETGNEEMERLWRIQKAGNGATLFLLNRNRIGINIK